MDLQSLNVVFAKVLMAIPKSEKVYGHNAWHSVQHCTFSWIFLSRPAWPPDNDPSYKSVMCHSKI